MACFLVPLAEAVALSCVKGAVKLGNKKESDKIIAFGKKTAVLQKMLFGGSFLLAIEHVYHGEVVFYPPFLTAMKSPEDTAEMLHEMGTAGVSMAIVVTAVWAIAMIIQHFASKKAVKEKLQAVKPGKLFSVLSLAALGFAGAALMWSVDLIGAGENGILVALSAIGAAVFGVLSVKSEPSMVSAK